MKKLILPFLIAAVAAAAGTYFYLNKGLSGDVVSPESILPSETLAIIEVKNLEKDLNEIWNSKLGENLKKINLEKTAQSLDIPKASMVKYEKFKKEINSEVNKEAFYNFFGKNFSIALTSFEITKDFGKDPKKSMPGIAFLSIPKTSAKLTQMLSGAAPGLKKVSETDYNGTKIIKSSYNDKFEFFHFVEKGYLIATLKSKTAQNILDASKSGKNLASTERFKDIKKDIEASKRDFFIYFDLEKMFTAFDEAAKVLPLKELKEARKNLNRDFKYIAYAGFSKSETEYFTNIRSKQNSKNEVSPIDPKDFLNMVPEDVITFSWQNNFDPKKIVKQILGTDEAIKQFESKLNIELGLKAEKLYSDTKGKLGLIITDIDTNGMFPVPEMALIFNQSASSSFNDILSFMQKKQQGQIPLSKKDINGYEVNFISLPFGKALEPSWSVVDDNFIFSINSGLIAGMTDASKNGANVENNDLYKYVNKDLPKKCNSVSFFNTKKFFTRLIDTGSSLSKLMAMRTPEASKKADIVLKEFFTPLFNGLTMYEATGQRVYFEGDELYGKSVSKIAP